ncbi:hypothetical protein AVEN_201892-1 [Araneus ventricosus]|uniref:Uncharacterized protein n=1 Tax=Araneus ventricosus TaxID=182803 RepID=A0A4Y2U3W0_ARAVE|nr:hypothetical protein AVEN_201892-1 [Araneus ventricosus]
MDDRSPDPVQKSEWMTDLLIQFRDLSGWQISRFSSEISVDDRSPDSVQRSEWMTDLLMHKERSISQQHICQKSKAGVNLVSKKNPLGLEYIKAKLTESIIHYGTIVRKIRNVQGDLLHVMHVSIDRNFPHPEQHSAQGQPLDSAPKKESRRFGVRNRTFSQRKKRF